MNQMLEDNLQYLHDKLMKVEQTPTVMFIIHPLRVYIKNGELSPGFRHDIQLHLGKALEEARINKANKDIHTQCRDIDIMYCANELYYASMLTFFAIGTKQEHSIAKHQAVRIEKAKKVLDLL